MDIKSLEIKSLEIKNKTNYDWDDIIYINDFDANSLEIIKRESRIGANIYYIRYVLDYDYNTTKPLYIVINRLIGYIEEIEGSSDKYLVVVNSSPNKNIKGSLDNIWSSIEIKMGDMIYLIPNIKIKDYNKFRFNSDTDLPLNTIIEFRSILINVSCVIKKDNECYPEIYLEECLYVKGNIWPTTT